MPTIWEEKRINPLENLDIDATTMRLQCRDWLLGGLHFEWRFWTDPLTGEYVLQRR